jgi:RNA polymerase sigma factor (sigma-70 family)
MARQRVRFSGRAGVLMGRKPETIVSCRERQGMANEQPPLTRLTLLGALCRGLRWEEFLALYGRLILAWGRQDFGLQEQDAENLRQEVLIRVWKGLRSYDPARGRFRSWLYACTRNAVFDLRHAEPAETTPRRLLVDEGERRGEISTGPVSAQLWREAPDLESGLRALEDEGFAPEGYQQLVAAVRARVQACTWKAFLLFEFFDLRAKEVAQHLGLTPAAVNQAVHRVRQLLQQAWAARHAGQLTDKGACR